MGDLSRLDQYDAVLESIVGILTQARSAAARSVNAVMTATYWHIGHVIVEQEQEQGGEARAEYGKELMARLAVDLTEKFGRGFSRANLYQMRQFRLAWPPDAILQTLPAKSQSPQILQTASGESPSSDVAPAAATDLAALARAFPLPWSAYVKLLSARSDEARRFYDTEALRNGWTVKQLDRQINSLYGENPPAGIILCSDKGTDEARYALESLGNPVLATEYRLALPDERLLEAELAKTRRHYEAHLTPSSADSD